MNVKIYHPVHHFNIEVEINFLEFIYFCHYFENNINRNVKYQPIFTSRKCAEVGNNPLRIQMSWFRNIPSQFWFSPKVMDISLRHPKHLRAKYTTRQWRRLRLLLCCVVGLRAIIRMCDLVLRASVLHGCLSKES